MACAGKGAALPRVPRAPLQAARGKGARGEWMGSQRRQGGVGTGGRPQSPPRATLPAARLPRASHLLNAVPNRGLGDLARRLSSRCSEGPAEGGVAEGEDIIKQIAPARSSPSPPSQHLPPTSPHDPKTGEVAVGYSKRTHAGQQCGRLSIHGMSPSSATRLELGVDHRPSECGARAPQFIPHWSGQPSKAQRVVNCVKFH